MHPHREPGRADRCAAAAEPAAQPRLLPVEVQRGRGGVRARGCVRGGMGEMSEARVAATDIADLPAAELRRRIAARDLSAVEGTQGWLAPPGCHHPGIYG